MKDNNCTTDKFKYKNCMGLWGPDKICKDTDCTYHKDYNKYRDGEPCNHPGCCSHVSHPCEVCGRTACKQ